MGENRGPWPGGINNRANWKTTPNGFLVDSVNIDPLQGGLLSLRSGYSKVYTGTQVRGALAVGDHVLLADGTDLVDFNRATNVATVIAQIAGAGRFAGAVLNGELFFCTDNQTFRYKAGVLRPWGVPTVTAQPIPTVGAGGLEAGTYQCAATILDAYGDEGATVNPITITVPQASSLEFPVLPDVPPGGRVRLYISSVNGSELYLQHTGPGPYSCTSVRDDSPRLDTLNLDGPVSGDFIADHNGILLIADGPVLYYTLPLRPHLRSPAAAFFQFGAPIDGVLSGDGGVFVAADSTYFISGIETKTPTSKAVFPYGAVRGTFIRVDKASDTDYRAAWMTQYGVAKSDGNGGATLLSAANFVPELAESGSSGMINANGNQLVVTTLQGAKGSNPLVASDYYEAEIVTP